MGHLVYICHVCDVCPCPWGVYINCINLIFRIIDEIKFLSHFVGKHWKVYYKYQIKFQQAVTGTFIYYICLFDYNSAEKHFWNKQKSYFLLSGKGSRKKKVLPLMTGQLSEGGGGKGRAIKEKKTFLKLFFCCHLKIKIILL